MTVPQPRNSPAGSDGLARFATCSMVAIGLGSGLVSCSSAAVVGGASVSAGTTTLTVPPTARPGVTGAPTMTKPTGPPCVGSQLAWDFRGGGLGTGNDFGGLAVRNTGPTACQLIGSVQIAALDARQHPIQTLQPLPAQAVPAGVVLSAGAPRWLGSQPPPPGVFYADVYLMGGERDNPRTGGLCSAGDEVTPAYWRVSMQGISWIVTNHDPGIGPDDKPDVPSLYACLANFNIAGIVQIPS